MRVSLLPGLLLPLLFAASPQEPKPIPPAERGTSLFHLKAGVYDLPDLLGKSADFLGYVYLFPSHSFPPGPSSRGGKEALKVEIAKDLDLGRLECEDLMSRLAYSFGWIRTPLEAKNGIYQWVNMFTQERNLVKARAPFVTPEEILARPNLCQVVYTSLSLKNADPRQLAATLRPLFSDPSSFLEIVSAGNSNSIVLSGTRGALAMVIRMVRKIDQEGTVRKSSLLRAVATLEARISALEKRVRALEKERKPRK